MNPNMSIVSGEIFETAYSQKNYCIIDNPAVDSEYCVILFSSAGIYYPNTEESLRDNILIKDRYEWWKAKFPFVSRYIFVRDVVKAFYMKGISKENPDIEHVIRMLKEATKGYKVFTIGSSAGGYMAVLTGCLLENCEYVLDFSGYYNLFVLDGEKWPLIEQNKGFEKYSKWFDLERVLKKKSCDIYRFYPTELDEDRLQTEYASGENVVLFPIKSRRHGIPFSKNNLYKLISLDKIELDRLHQQFKGNKSISELQFSIALNGKWCGFWRVIEGKLQEKFKIGL